MFTKRFAALLFAAFAAAAVQAADFVALDLNFYSTERIAIRPVGKLPPGVTMPKPIRYRNPELKGLAFPIRINLERTRTIDLTLTVTGGGRICPSLNGFTANARGRRTGSATFRCVSLVFCDEPSTVKLPCVVRKWTNMLPRGIDVSDGETLTVRATFEKVR